MTVRAWDAVRGAFGWVLAGVVALGIAALLPHEAFRGAIAQDWSPFALVAGLLLVGLAADDDGLFSWVGGHLAGVSSAGWPVLLLGSVVVIIVTALLNLDTAVAFLTPVMLHVARRRGAVGGGWLYGPLLLANAGSLWLPGSNLTNLLVMGQLHLTGAQYVARMGGPALGATVVAIGAVMVRGRRDLGSGRPNAEPVALRLGAGSLAVLGATTTMLVTSSPALIVLAIGLAVAAWRVVRGWDSVSRVVGALEPAPLLGLFGVAVLAGAVGRVWSGPAQLLAHAGGPPTAALGAGAAVLINNLPAASLLASHVPAHPLALLLGLNLGPNLAPTGSLAWLLWRRTARAAGAAPSMRAAVGWGVPVAVATLVVATLWLELAGLH